MTLARNVLAITLQCAAYNARMTGSASARRRLRQACVGLSAWLRRSMPAVKSIPDLDHVFTVILGRFLEVPSRAGASSKPGQFTPSIAVLCQ